MAKNKKGTQADKMWGLTRISLGFIFLWAFIDKVFGLGFATCRAENGAVSTMCDAAWINGGSPTQGFLGFATQGPFADIYKGMAGNPLVDCLFMFGLLGLGITLILGIGMRIATFGGVLLMLLMWSAVLPPANNPIIDEHIVYALVLIGLLKVNKTQQLGFGQRWQASKLVKKYPILT